MEWIKRMNQAVSYIEDHLTEEIRYEELAGRPAVPPIIFSGCSGTWQGFRSRNISGAGGCPWLPWI